VLVDVPNGWPVVDGMHTGFCAGPFPTTPTAFVGPQQAGAPSCPPAPPGSSGPPRDGVWLQPDGGTPAGPTLHTAGGEAVTDEGRASSGTGSGATWHMYSDRGVRIEIGNGPNPNVAHSIVESIRFGPGTPDTPAAGVCPRSADPDAEPTPERLAQRLVLNHGDVTLDPPASGDEPVMTADSAWRQTQPHSPVEHYRLILARYSAKFPARQNPDGSYTPMNQNELAWVIYSTPPSPQVEGCAGWGLAVFDAKSGQEQTQSGYSPGP